MASSTRQIRSELSDVVSNPERLVRAQTKTPSSPVVASGPTDQGQNERSPESWPVQAQKASTQDGSDENDEQSHPNVEDGDEPEKKKGPAASRK